MRRRRGAGSWSSWGASARSRTPPWCWSNGPDRFVDAFFLLMEHGRWVIANKVFHRFPPGAVWTGRGGPTHGREVQVADDRDVGDVGAATVE